MNFLDEKKKSGKRPDYADVDKDGNRDEPMAKAFKDKEKAKNEEIGYGKDPETGKITPMSSNDAINNWLNKVMRDLDNEEGNIEENKKTVELPANTTFTLDLKHLMKKHMDEGKSAKNTLTLTKALMKKLHNNGEVKVNGTKLVFKENKNSTQWRLTINKNGSPNETILYKNEEEANKEAEKINKGSMDREGAKFTATVAIKEADVPMDMPVNLPEPEVKKPRRKGPPRLVAFDTDQDSHFTGEDDYDYEGSMAKSELLKMKKYANALCDMIEDESQLESWLQAKITKAADYMSSVYHYLDYQDSKMDEGRFDDPGHERMNRDRADRLNDEQPVAMKMVPDTTLDRFSKEFGNPNPSGPPYSQDLIQIRKANFKRFLEKAAKDGFFIPISMPIAINLWKGEATEENIRLLNKKNGDFAVKWYNDYKDGKYASYLAQDVEDYS